MKKLRLGFAVFYLVALLLSLTAFQAAAQDANFVGNWDMTTAGDGHVPVAHKIGISGCGAGRQFCGQLGHDRHRRWSRRRPGWWPVRWSKRSPKCWSGRRRTP